VSAAEFIGMLEQRRISDAVTGTLGSSYVFIAGTTIVAVGGAMTVTAQAVFLGFSSDASLLFERGPTP
jgi:hypothetical protein